MTTRLIRLSDETLVEVDVRESHVQDISGSFADRVSSTFERVKPILVNVCNPVVSAWGEINQKMNVQQAEIELGLNFEAEGNLYVTKSKASANLTIKLILHPKEDDK